jgi:hypothetical protein
MILRLRVLGVDGLAHHTQIVPRAYGSAQPVEAHAVESGSGQHEIRPAACTLGLAPAQQSNEEGCGDVRRRQRH